MEVEFKAVAQKVSKDPISNGKSGPCLHRCFLVNQSIVLVFQYPRPGSYTNTELYFKVSTSFGMESGFQVDVSLISQTNKQTKDMGFSDFCLHALVHKQFKKSVSCNTIVSSQTSKVVQKMRYLNLKRANFREARKR